MIKGLYTSASAMLPKTLKLDVSANNIANVSTPGFKKQSVFLETLKSHLLFAEKGTVSQPVQQQQETTDFSQGGMQPTGNPLDVGLSGEGFFSVKAPDGLRLTRDGHFKLNNDGVLVTAAGFPVQGKSGEIRINGGRVDISRDGSIFVDGELAGTLRIVQVEDPQQLLAKGENTWATANENTPKDLPTGETSVIQHHLELSNVSMINELKDMIEIERGFETDQKMVITQDDSLGKLIGQVGHI